MSIRSTLICSTDRQALGAYKVIREREILIPEDISVISFGGYDVSELLTPQLATVRFDSEYSGKCCARTILKMLKGEKVQTPQYVNYTFIEGESVSISPALARRIFIQKCGTGSKNMQNGLTVHVSGFYNDSVNNSGNRYHAKGNKEET